ncbi:regulatory subunit of cyclin-dependent kinase [Russula aff. rugulosa BPL654]|nr:regulatory subunit of cyclin-dependent kinase [Russula aff. rugulosa BPL654]
MASKQTQKTQQQQQQQQQLSQAQLAKQKAAEEAEKIKEYIAKQVLVASCAFITGAARSEFWLISSNCFISIHYSDRYTDDEYEYRHVILPKPLFKMIPKSYFNPDDPGVLRLLSEAEWRGIGITQSLGWEHYEVHAPEPHVLLFRRAKNADSHQAALQAQEIHSQLKAAGAGKNGRKK